MTPGIIRMIGIGQANQVKICSLTGERIWQEWEL